MTGEVPTLAGAWRKGAIVQQRVGQRTVRDFRTVREDRELGQDATHKDFLLVRREGSRDVQRSVACYTLDATPSKVEHAYLESVKQAQREIEGGQP